MPEIITIEPPALPIDHRWLVAIGGAAAIERNASMGVRRLADRLELKVRFSKAERRALRKKQQILASNWAERYRVLPDTARFRGPWRNENVAYLAGIMDASFFPSVEEVIVCAAPQTGKTEAVYTCLGYAIDRRPGNAMIVFPDELTAKDNAKDRIEPMIKDAPVLRESLTGYADDMGSIKLRLKHMIMYMAWANSPSRLANRPAMYGYADEEDKYPATASKKESGPVDLLRKRMRTFVGVRKLWRTSSPTVEKGPIWQALTKEAQLIFDYHVKCPACGAHQVMRFGDGQTKYGIKWTDGVRDALVIEASRQAWYQCAHCEARWNDADRDRAVRDGQWRDRATGAELFAALRSVQPLRIGFHLPAWLSPFVPLWEVAAAWLKTIGDKNKLKDFLNGYAAEPWKEFEAVRKETAILKLADDRPAGVVPGGGKVAALVAGIDTQDNGFWYEIRAVGWGKAPDRWGIRHGFVLDLASLEKVLLEDAYTDPEGERYHLMLACQDAMGHRTAEVYDFCREHRGLIVPTKGWERRAQPVSPSTIEYYPGSKKPIPGGLLLYNFDTNYIKNKLSSVLEVAPGDPGCWYYHSELDADYAMQMCAEGIDPKTGLWVNPNDRANHGWDCGVLCLLAEEILGVRFWPDPRAAAPVDNKKTAEKPQTARMW
ncbi:MAG: phage terminase large subunit family protein [Desulfobacteraceae bacterium]|nr:phage terminase large subunit family protein [Desulfobacteraceae bacterium]